MMASAISHNNRNGKFLCAKFLGHALALDILMHDSIASWVMDLVCAVLALVL